MSDYDTYDEWIEKEKARILEILRNSKLFDKAVDLDNIDTVIVAAFHAGWRSAWSMRTKLNDISKLIGLDEVFAG